MEEVKGVEEVERVEQVKRGKESGGLVVGEEQQGGGGATDAGGRWNWHGEGFPSFAPNHNRFRRHAPRFS